MLLEPFKQAIASQVMKSATNFTISYMYTLRDHTVFWQERLHSPDVSVCLLAVSWVIICGRTLGLSNEPTQNTITQTFPLQRVCEI